ncbi:TIGR03016 family PEP-CTERM system-associated outer membrane protein [Candidatus Litorirhabdus singularis]|uniref:TIGR03016 family PEP-CTERM system-associated outer membrane protein n=1 Tax=Candidatus Litorirhabdus singularis TaxID=2518993 RepID=UPI002430BBD0|nr:TIGR03016 family PEP-CTERM system-associated outer membrane protein [Candidatus Litorirhabdus singularis]
MALARLAVCIVGSVYACSGLAAEWTRSLSIAPKLVLTDNVCLESENPQSEWVASVVPRVGVNGKGARATFRLYGGLEFHSLDNNKNTCGSSGLANNRAKSPIPSWGAIATSELARDLFFFDAGARGSTNNVSEFVSGSDDALNRSGNLNITHSYYVRPYIDTRLKSFAQLYLAYQYDDQINSSDLVGDSTKESVSLRLSSIASAIYWRINGSWNELRYDRPASTSELASLSGTVGTNINRELSINGTIGKEYNDYLALADEIDGEFWDVGFVWTPHSRFTLTAGIGDRFYGPAPRFSVSYRHKRQLFVAGYSRTLSYTRDLRTLDENSNQDILVDESGDVGADPEEINQGQPTTLNRAPILNDRFYTNYRYQGKRSSFSLGASYSDQTRAGAGNDVAFTRVNAGIGRTLTSNLSVRANASWYEYAPDTSDGSLRTESQTRRIGFSLNRKFAQKTSASLSYQYTERESDSDFNNYQENRLTLSVRFAY